MKFLIITKSDCPWCVKLKEYMADEGIEYTEVSANGDIGAWKTFIQFTGLEKVTLPQVFQKELFGENAIRRIGGYEEFVSFHSGKE